MLSIVHGQTKQNELKLNVIYYRLILSLLLLKGRQEFSVFFFMYKMCFPH